jgi:agmatinase
MKKYLFFSLSSLLLQTRSSLSQQTALLANTALNTDPWNSKYGTTADPLFSGLLSFSHLPYYTCLTDVQHEHKFDLAVLGIPFDTATTYRPGARFGPYAIRSGSRRQYKGRGYSLSWGINPYQASVEVVDCGDVGAVLFVLANC